ncbi:beta-ketoacyl synthase N-terminal-like domain-containing protein [Tenacibaculum sp. IB213877]|uniref:beta-ketoacyl synthase N-terminal-like domain-containing protein n=1 Tax=Tenacibaculum sp. IB213877 TaxID=3097351 RepID=UPI002A5A29C4|nr:beta-ketoacyl synthase N-terminal-like domain-containing protein [Tenacibaculum sp. IB213877]MDY0780626.1 beta-ketoacyl synthase N-terminal-like domain-containing protein [Tenacibaculum sp. IB213877]
MINPISITSFASISALGSTSEEVWKAYLDNNHRISTKDFGDFSAWVAQLSNDDKKIIEQIKNSDNKYKNLDDTVLFALYASRKAVEKAGWKPEDNFGINIGSSRGATSLFEKYHKEFLDKGVSSTLSSPTTTLGNISSWVAHDLQTNGPEVSHSITCSTALHSLLNGVAWVNSGMCDKFLVGGSEAPLTDFTVAQMQALKVYAKRSLSEVETYPCKALDLEKTKNTMVLGEGASVICLEKGESTKAIAKIEGIGYATEVLKHNTSVTADAECFQKSMKMATQHINLEEVDAIVMHAPGTIKGDSSEVNAIKKVFGNRTPFLTTNKWKLGHTFGASGLLSLELALLMLQHQQAVRVPFAQEQIQPKKLNKILVNAVGFGGNAVSVLISK